MHCHKGSMVVFDVGKVLMCLKILSFKLKGNNNKDYCSRFLKRSLKPARPDYRVKVKHFPSSKGKSAVPSVVGKGDVRH